MTCTPLWIYSITYVSYRSTHAFLVIICLYQHFIEGKTLTYAYFNLFDLRNQYANYFNILNIIISILSNNIRMCVHIALSAPLRVFSKRFILKLIGYWLHLMLTINSISYERLRQNMTLGERSKMPLIHIIRG